MRPDSGTQVRTDITQHWLAVQQLDLNRDLPQGPAALLLQVVYEGKRAVDSYDQELRVQQTGYLQSTVTDLHLGSLFTGFCTQLSCNKCQDLPRLDRELLTYEGNITTPGS